MIAAVLILNCGWALSGQKSGKKHGNDETVGDKIREIFPESEPVFTVQDRWVISGYYHHEGKGLPPGLAKKDRLPPGLEKHLQKHGTLPPGLQKKVQPLPVTLERQLCVLPTGYRRVVVGGNIVLMNEKTAMIYDIVRVAIP